MLANAHWWKEEEENVMNNIESDASKTKCKEILHDLANKNNGYDLDQCVKRLNEVIFMANAGNCRVTFHKVPKPRIHRGGRTNQPLFDKECHRAKDKMTNTGNFYRKRKQPLPPAY